MPLLHPKLDGEESSLNFTHVLRIGIAGIGGSAATRV
jgi:hypothetical protein